MTAEPFHLGWFLGNGFGVYAWDDPWGGTQGRDYAKPDFYVDLARQLERACFDFVMLEDGSFVPDGYNDSAELYLKLPTGTPKHDPAVTIPFMAAVTNRLGLVPTLSTSEYPPFLLARLVSTLDHVSNGRAGWNVVTSRSEATGQNHGRDFPEKEDRYAIADEYLDLVRQLWHSWEPDAIVRDLERGVFADYTKVHRIEFKGKYFQSRGPPQRLGHAAGRAGDRPGRPIAGRASVRRQALRRHRRHRQGRGEPQVLPRRPQRPDDHRGPQAQRLQADVPRDADPRRDHGRGERTSQALERVPPDGSRVGAGLGQQGQWRRLREVRSRRAAARRAADEEERRVPGHPAPAGHVPRRRHRIHPSRGCSSPAAAAPFRGANSIEFVGTPDAVASQMGEAMQEIGGDGWLVQNLYITRRYVAEICDGLVPELQRRGLTRTSYGHTTFRENLLEF